MKTKEEMRAYKREYARQWRKKHPDAWKRFAHTESGRVRAAHSSKRYRQRHPDRVNLINGKWRAKNPKKVSMSKRYYHIKKKYGLSREEYEATCVKQGGLCMICKQSSVLRVDHDHATEQLRDFLCHHCNAGLGMFLDDPKLLDAAAAYLRKHGK